MGYFEKIEVLCPILGIMDQALKVVCEQFLINPVGIIISCNVFRIKDGTIWHVEKKLDIANVFCTSFKCGMIWHVETADIFCLNFGEYFRMSKQQTHACYEPQIDTCMFRVIDGISEMTNMSCIKDEKSIVAS